MFGKFSQSGIRPVALGTTVNSSTYGQTIPVIYGRMKSAMYLTWMANIRSVGSKFKKKKGVTTYAANVDFLVGTNPILSPLQFWLNQNQKLPLKFAALNTYVYTGLNQTVTISDPDFYAVLAVTTGGASDGPVTLPLDYGAVSQVTVPKLGQSPCWNAAFRGPDPTWPTTMRGYYYYWTPSMGNSLLFTQGFNGQATIYYAKLFPGGAAQYGKKTLGGGTDVPAAALNLTWEPVLGDGPEYTGKDQTSGVSLASQQIFYPCYAGLGSEHYESAGSALPEASVEVLGSYNLNGGAPGVDGGDADFCDMIEDIFKQGISQPGYATVSDPLDIQSINTHSLQHGLACYDLPGIVNAARFDNFPSPFFNAIPYPLPNAAGNFLVVFGNGGVAGGALSGISDDAGDTWNVVGSLGYVGAMWWAQSVGAPALNNVVISGIGYTAVISLIEIAGVDTFDSSGMVAGQRTISITTTNDPGYPAYIVVFVNYGFAVLGPHLASWDLPVPGWRGITSPNNTYVAYSKIVYQPGTYVFSAPASFGPPPQMYAVAFKSTIQSPYPKPLGNILDQPSLELTRNQCRAYGLWGSLVMDSQQKASDWLETIYKAANAAPVWSGFKLKSIPYSEQSYAGNGTIYTSPTSAGPVGKIPAGDFIHADDTPLYEVERSAQVDVPNVIQLQIPSRASDYNDVTVSQPITSTIALFGTRKDSPQQFRCIVDPTIARMIINIQLNRINNLRDNYKFKLNAKWKLLEPMDLITLPADPVTGAPPVDVRITKVDEDENYQLDFEADPFIFGTNAPVPGLTTQSVTPYQPFTGPGVPLINTPLIFEPVPRLLNQDNQGQIWCVVSAPGGQISAVVVTTGFAGLNYQVGDVLTIVQTGASGGTVTVTAVDINGVITNWSISGDGKNYSPATGLATTGGHGSGAQFDITATGNTFAGCAVNLSTDGGLSYNQIGSIQGNATTGYTVGDWPSANDPDTTNDLSVDLTESQGTLLSYQVQDEDDFNWPCYVDGGGTSIIPYELMTYAVATLTATSKYTLKATGSGHHLRRAVFGAPQPQVGVDHPNGSRFAFLGAPGTQTTQGIFKLNLDPRWLGVTLYFKFTGFNSLGGNIQALADVTAYTYTPTGVAQQENPNANTYVNTPAIALSRSILLGVHHIDMSGVQVAFPGNTVKYVPRDFAISTPSPGTVYYVTIADPKFVGDTISAFLIPNLTATCQTSNALVGVPGNIYIGFIKIIDPSNTSKDIVGPGGIPQPFVAVVGP